MFYIIAMIVIGLGAVAAWVSGRFVHDHGLRREDERAIRWGSAVRLGAPLAAIVVALILTLASVLHTVPAGQVGIVRTFGAITGQTGDGLVVTWPWQNLEKESIQVQTLAFMSGQEFGKLQDTSGVTLAGDRLTSFSKESQNVYVSTIVRIRVSEGNVQSLIRNVGSNYVSKLIPGQISQRFKDETVKYAAVDIAPNREPIRSAVENTLRQELLPKSIDVDAVLLENISFDQGFEDAILAKQQASQEALRQQELIKAKQAEADQVVAQAKGQAEANRLISQSLTDDLIRFQALQKLADNVQIALIPSGQGIIIDPSTLLGAKPSPTPAP